jgi:hypothetical protein
MCGRGSGAGQVASKRADVGTAATRHVQSAKCNVALSIELGVGERERVDRDVYGGECDFFPAAGKVVGAYAIDMLGGVSRRNLSDGADELRCNGAEGVGRRAWGFECDRSRWVFGVGLGAECYDRFVELRFIEDESGKTSGAADEQNQQSCSEWIECARMADALFAECTARDGDDVVGRDARRLVDEQQPVSARRLWGQDRRPLLRARA